MTRLRISFRWEAWHRCRAEGATTQPDCNKRGGAIKGIGVYVCSYNFFSAGTANVGLTSGTGTACGTGMRKRTPRYQFTAQTGIVQPQPQMTYQFATAAGEALCIDVSAAVAVQAQVKYAQF